MNKLNNTSPLTMIINETGYYVAEGLPEFYFDDKSLKKIHDKKNRAEFLRFISRKSALIGRLGVEQKNNIYTEQKDFELNEDKKLNREALVYYDRINNNRNI